MTKGEGGSDQRVGIVTKGEGGSDERFVPVSEEFTMAENSYSPRVYYNANRIWETEIIPSQIWTNKQSDVPV